MKKITLVLLLLSSFAFVSYAGDDFSAVAEMKKRKLVIALLDENQETVNELKSKGKANSNIENIKYKFKNETTFLEDKIIGDSIEFSQKEIDTLFIFSDKQKAKRINGKLVISDKDSIYWQSKLVYLNKDELVIKYLYSDDDLRKLDSITKIKSKKIDSTTYVISPSRSEFKRFFEVTNFGFDIKYKKVSK